MFDSPLDYQACFGQQQGGKTKPKERKICLSTFVGAIEFYCHAALVVLKYFAVIRS